MAVCGNRLLTGILSQIPHSRQILATHRPLLTTTRVTRSLHTGRRSTGWSYSCGIACRRIRTVGVCGSGLKVEGGRFASTMAPISTKGLDPGQIVDKYIAENKVMIFSKSFCPFCHKVRNCICFVTVVNVKFLLMV